MVLCQYWLINCDQCAIQLLEEIGSSMVSQEVNFRDTYIREFLAVLTRFIRVPLKMLGIL